MLSNASNKPAKNYAPVHRFGEVVSYDLNKYNFDYDSCIYLSVQQSKNQKAAVANVPSIIGSMFGNGLWLLVGSAGAVVGVGGTMLTQFFIKKKKTNATAKS